MAATQIAQRQLQDGIINDQKVAAGAGIATSKLADGPNFIKKDGSVAMTGALNMGSQLVTNVNTPSSGTDAANKNYVDNQIATVNKLFDAKGSVRAATTGNVTLSGTQTIDGVALVAADRVLVKNQTAPAENGIYVVAAGAWTRVVDMDEWLEVPGAFVAVEEGTTQADTVWLCTANSGGTLETTAITWQQIPTTAGLSNANFADDETPSGTINGSNVTFTLANTPVVGSVRLFLNGLRLKVGAGNDYTISGSTITMLTAPINGEILTADYRK